MDIVFVAQLVEQLTLNQWVQGSSPCEDTTPKALLSGLFIMIYFFCVVEKGKIISLFLSKKITNKLQTQYGYFHSSHKDQQGI